MLNYLMLTAWGKTPLSAGRFARRIGNDGFSLRFRRVRDLPYLHDLFHCHIFQKNSSFGRRSPLQLLLFIKWLLSTFQVFYVIEADMKSVGFIGLYDFEIGKKSWVSVAIFDPVNRRKGYGRKGIDLLCNYLKDNKLAEKLYAEVLEINTESVSFFRAVGFKIKEEDGERVILEKKL